ncbi:MAG: glycosyltransferase family 2 protein [Lachnospiraceae bacterium]|jgi:glycosyltransferase involved in cell wall biosynthesis
MNSTIHLSLVVPCYNEQDNVRAFYDEARRAFEGCGYRTEIVMVNDGSRDRTGEELDALWKEEHESFPLTVVHFSRNFGKEAAILAGLRQAQGEYTAIIDADLQQPPAIVRKMVKILDLHPETDVVAAYQGERHENAGMTMAKTAFYRLINRISEVTLHPDASDFRCFRSSVKDAVLSLPETSRFTKGIFAWVGFTTYYIPYEVRERHAGTSKWNFVKLFRYAIEGILGYTVSPLKWPLIPGVGCTLIGIVALIAQAVRAAAGSDVRYGVIVSLLFLFFGLTMLAVGVMGEYLARVYLQDKNRPVYIAKKILRSSDSGEAVGGSAPGTSAPDPDPGIEVPEFETENGMEDRGKAESRQRH